MDATAALPASSPADRPAPTRRDSRDGDDQDGRTPSVRSLSALDAVNLFLADVRDGLGPFLGIFLVANAGWNAGAVGTAMAVAGIATVAAQSPAGLIVDRVSRRRWLLALASLLIGAATLAVVFRANMTMVIASQVVVGVAATFVQPTLAAITLGLVGHKRFDRRVGRNETFNHAGNAAAAVLTGVLGYFLGIDWIFYLTAILAVGGIISVLMIREDDIDPYLARGATRDECADDGNPVPRPTAKAAAACKDRLSDVLKDRRIVWLSTAVILFHLANAYMLPLAGQKMAHNGPEHPNAAVAFQAGAILAAQAVMTPVAGLAGWLASTRGRKATLLIGFAILPVRGVLYTLSDSPWFVLGVQLLDGVGAGIFGVVSLIMIADLTRGTGRFNAVQGLLFTAVGIGASISALVTGQLVQHYGYNTGFLFLAGVAVVALAVLWLKVDETSGLGDLTKARNAPKRPV